MSMALTAAAAEPTPQPAVQSPVAPDESLRHFALHPDLRIELVAHEPQVVDPVAVAFDENGRLWVVEMRDYPNGPAEGEPPQSRIRLLEDRDEDGHYETAHTFADGLLFATGLQPWRGGVIVTLAGEVAWMADTDGDHKADVRQTWFTGFVEENPQLRANHPTFAMDNHIYIANGLRGGTVAATGEAARLLEAAGLLTDGQPKPVSISGMDFRFDPLTGHYEAVSGAGQFGLTFDDFGNRFVCSNRNPCRHIVLEDRYLKRNPHLAVPSIGHDVSAAGEASRVYPLAAAWTTSTLHAGQFTAACGVTIYRGDALPESFRGNSFTCEPTGSLVHRDVLSPQGATFTSQPGRDGVEFLASRDAWFRPVNMAHGPDGALYVVDMYRAVIEHPQFMPAELKQRPDLTDGNDRGRIYRIVPRDAGDLSARRAVRLSEVSSAELVGLLEHPNAWHRMTAQRLLVERQDRSVIEPLERLAADGKTPQGRVHALWTLQGLGALTPRVRSAALDDPHPRVIEQSVELRDTADEPRWKEVLPRTDLGDARTQFQIALSLGNYAGPPSDLVEPLADIALRHAADPWVRTAVLSSAAGEPVPLLRDVLQGIKLLARRASEGQRPDPLLALRASDEGYAELVGELAELIGSRQQGAEIQGVLKLLSEMSAGAPLPMAMLDGLGRGLARRGGALSAYVAKAGDDVRSHVRSLFQRAAKTAADPQADRGRRTEAVGLLRYADADTAIPTLAKIVAEGDIQSLRIAAIEVLARFTDASIGPLLVGDYAAQTPAVRRAVLDALLARPDRVRLLLDEIEAKRIAASELGPIRERRLTQHADKTIRARAAQLLSAATPADRREVMQRYQPALSLSADPIRGRAVFTKHCTTCHRIGELGVNVAPDIADSRTRQPAALLTDVLDPNRAIDNNYLSYTVLTVQGQVHTGIISAETATSITLKQPEGKTLTLLREDIDELRSDGVSLMPVGLEKNIPVQDMADLISFIKNWRYLKADIPVEATPAASK